MRVAMYMPGLAPGTASWAIYQDLASAIRRQGIEFDVLSTSSGRTDSGTTPGTHFLQLPTRFSAVDRLVAPLLRTRTTLANVAALRGVLAEARPDVLYVEIVYPTGAAAALARKTSRWIGALVLMPAGEDFLVVPEADYGFRRHLGPRRAFAWALRQADAVRYISPLVRDDLETLVRSPSALIPASVSNTALRPTEWHEDELVRRRQRARAELAARHDVADRRLIVSLGRLHPFKGLHVLVEAMVDVPDAVLVVAGPSLATRRFGDYGRYLARLANRLGIEERVHLIGPVEHDRVPTLLAAADVAAVPSLRESQNRVCVEAAAVGTPFVVTRTTGVAAFVPGDGVGRIIEPGDASSLAQALRDCLSDDPMQHRADAVAFARSFAADRIAPLLVELFRSSVST